MNSIIWPYFVWKSKESHRPSILQALLLAEKKVTLRFSLNAIFLRSLKQVIWKKSIFYFLSPQYEYNANTKMKSSMMKLSYTIPLTFSVLS